MLNVPPHIFMIVIRHITVLKERGMSKAAFSLSVSRGTAGRTECLEQKERKKKKETRACSFLGTHTGPWYVDVLLACGLMHLGCFS